MALDAEKMNSSLKEYEEFFEPVAGALTAFSQAHTLLIEKYRHDAPVWSLCFRHPAGGHAKIDVSRANDEVEAQGVWWIDNYDLFTRNLKWGEKNKVERSADALAAVLATQLKDVLSWKVDQWNQTATGYENSWKPFTKAAFYAMGPHWPIPIP